MPTTFNNTNPIPIQSALEVLEKQINYIPFKHSISYNCETIITPETKQSCISWLVLQGFSKRNVQKNSLQTLGKLYGIQNYFNKVLIEENRNTNRNPTKEINLDINTPQAQAPAFYPPAFYPDIDFFNEKNRDYENQNSTQNFNETEKLIRKIINEKRTQILEEVGEKNLTLYTRITSDIDQKIKNDFNDQYQNLTEIIKNETKKQSQHQQDELKKIIEDLIFKGYLNQKLQQNPPQDTPQKEISNTENITNARFIPKIDPNYHFDPYATKVIRSALQMCENLYVYGDTGCGKTTHLEQVCAVLSRGIIRVNPHDGITREMFLGGMKLINNETIFIEGALPIAMRNGYVFLVDEISFLPPNLTAILNPIGEHGGKLYIPETSEWIEPSPGFCIFATDNTGGKGDRTGQYTGTEVQNTATLDRFAFCIKMDYLPREKEYEMLIKRFPNQNQDEIKGMLGLAQDIRSAFSRGELSITLSTRKLIKFFDQRSNNFTISEALSNTLLSWLDEDDEILVKTMIDRLELSKLSQPSNLNSDLINFDSEVQANRLVNAIKILRKIVSDHNGIIWDLKSAKDTTEQYRDKEISLEDISQRIKKIINSGASI